MKIITIPHPKLKTVSTPVEKVDKKLISFIKELESTLRNKKNPEGVGLSAPQVAKNIRIFSTYLDWGKGREIKTYINPQVIKTSDKLSLGGPADKPFLEGCLSIPKIYGPVWRHQWIKLEWQVINPQTLEFETRTKRFESFPARVVQHEFDHLQGILFTERALEQDLQLFREDGNDLAPIQVQ